MREKKKLISRLFEKKNWRRVVQVLSCMVVFCTTYALILPAITQEARAYCGTEAHEHSAECYEKILSCTKEEHQHDESCRDEEGNLVCVKEEHFHNADCFREVMNCEKQVHQHSLICYSDPYADLETPDDWVRSLPKDKDRKPTTRENVIAAALSQENVKESDKNYQVDNETEIRGITRYGQWDGSPYLDDWSGAFVRFLLHYSGVSSEKVHPKQELIEWMNELNRLELLSQISEGKEGDIVFINNTENEIRAGLILSINKDERTFTAMMGDWGRKVSKQKYSLDSDKIHSVFKLPVTDDPVEEPKDEDTETNVNESESVDKNITDNNDLKPEENSEKKETNNDSSDEPEKNEESNKNDQEPIFNNSNEADLKEIVLETTADNGIAIRAYINEKSFKDVSEISFEAKAVYLTKEQRSKVVEAAGIGTEQLKSVSYDLTFYQKNNDELRPIEPEAPVRIEIIDSNLAQDNSEISVVHIDDSGKTERIKKVETVNDSSEPKVQFTSDSFSTYVIVQKFDGEYDFQKAAVLSDGTEITASWNSDAFGSDSERITFEAKVSEISEQQTDEVLNSLEEENPILNVYDLSFYAARQSELDELVKVEPASKVEIKIQYPEEMEINKALGMVFHIQDDGNIEKIESESEQADLELVNSDSPVISFTSDSFSKYVTITISGTNSDGLTNREQNVKWGYINILNEDITDWNPNHSSHKLNGSGETVIDLNGHSIKSNGPIFTVSDNHKLIIKNSKSGQINISSTSDPLGFRLDLRYIIFDDYRSNYHEAAENNTEIKQNWFRTKVSNISILETSGDKSSAFEVRGNATLQIENAAVASPTNGTGITAYGGKVDLENVYVIQGKRGLDLSNGNSTRIYGGAVSDHGRDSGIAEPGAGIRIQNKETNVILDGDVQITGNITRNEPNQRDNGGGGINVNAGTLRVEKAYINGNACYTDRTRQGWATGGGIKGVGGAQIILLDGAKIQGNLADNSGGGISLSEQNTLLFMKGGDVSENIAVDNEGGGISLQAKDRTQGYDGYATAILWKGSIHGNRSHTVNQWGGGGMFVGETANLILPNGAYVSNNKAEVYGGGIAGCSTGKIAVDDKVTVNNNRLGNVASANRHTTGDKKVDYTYSSAIGLTKDQAKDYFTAYFASVKSSFGGESALWLGNVDGELVNDPVSEWLTSQYCMGLTAQNLGVSNNEYLTVTDNYSMMHGGGILVNGYMVGGNVRYIYNSDILNIHGTKQVLNLETNEAVNSLSGFVFDVLDKNGNVIGSAESDSEGNISFAGLGIPDQSEGPHSFELLLKERSDSQHSDIIFDSSYYRLTVNMNTVKSEPVQITYVDPDTGKTETIIVVEYSTSITSINVSKVVNGSSQNYSADIDGKTMDAEHSNKKHWTVNLSKNNPAFTNYQIPNTTVEVSKKWIDNGSHPGEVTVQLKRKTETSAEETVDSGVILNSSNNWTYKWENLPTMDSSQNRYDYWVAELSVPGYISKVKNLTETVEPQIKTVKAWKRASELVAGRKYILVNPDSDQALGTATDNSDVTSKNTVNICTIVSTDGTGYYQLDKNVQVLDAQKIDGRTGTMLLASGTNIRLLGKYAQHSGFQWHTQSNSQGDLNGFEYDSNGLRLHRWDNDKNTTDRVIFIDGRFALTYNSSFNNYQIPYLYEETDIQVYDNNENRRSEFKFEITNTQISNEIHILKVDSNNVSKKLSGAEFTLYSDQNCTQVITSLITGEDGTAVFNNLNAGNYWIKETKAPNGYNPTNEVWSFSFDNNSGSEPEPVIIKTQTITNELIQYELPETGGSGTEMFKVAGSAMVTVAAVSYGFNRKKKRKEGEE